ncbi:hypothetical protein [Lacticaseibacillus paracasei]|uniref:Uncharacterized protein n=1 Tax=Lacticaseibacillus paracasei TaxID=1597 RepID=A0ABD7BTY2_LACPA|nr:hypothetical protein [Lacticaseibacillus paracasei]QOP56144.1 hypothetical protein HCJ88_10360 [Lacticaseibacillus paracasei]
MSSPYEWVRKQFLQSEDEFKHYLERQVVPQTSDLKKVYQRLYVIFLFYHRPELQKYLKSNYSDAAVSLMFDSYIALRTSQLTASVLTLRASLDQAIKGWCEPLEVPFDSTRFKQNRLELTKKVCTSFKSSSNLLRSKFQSASDDLQNNFAEASQLTHHLGVSNYEASGYLSEALNQSNNLSETVRFVLHALENVLTFIITLCRESFQVWDSSELLKILQITFSSTKSKTFVKLCKQ